MAMESGMMQKKLTLTKAIAASLALICATPVVAETKTSTYNVYLRGIKAGQLKYAYAQSGSNYSASGILQSTGIVGALAKYKFTASSSGKIVKGKHAPQSYQEDSNTGRRESQKSISYSNGIPRVTERKLPKSHWADPKKQKGTVDPMTAIALVLNDASAKSVCNSKIDLFDGARRVTITLSNPKKSGATLKCSGLYKRVDGFSKREMSEGTQFPFALNYALKGDIYRVSDMEISTLRGRARFVRQ